MSWSTRRYIREKENLEQERGWTDLELQASALRKKFFKKYIIDFDTFMYKTQVERDWAYIAKREYRYDVQLRSFAYGLFTANLVWMARMFMVKKVVWWPLLAVTPLGYAYWQPIFFQKHSKKFFDMCNIGEQYYLGKRRNEVLAQCNQLLDQEDF